MRIGQRENSDSETKGAQPTPTVERMKCYSVNDTIDLTDATLRWYAGHCVSAWMCGREDSTCMNSTYSLFRVSRNVAAISANHFGQGICCYLS